MQVIGIIAEYNPFHLGHSYQINEIKKRYPDSVIIAIISTNFTQRGDISILNKWEKTTIALEYGIDLVIELPTYYATQSADIFASGALSILNKFKIDTLIFGTECGDIELLKKAATIQLDKEKYDHLVKEYLKTGINYPTALNNALKDLNIPHIDKPNDLLGLSYIKEIIKNNYNINPVTIQRTNDYHAKTVDNSIISANLIREKLLKNEDISPYIPELTGKYLTKHIDISIAYPLLTYAIITNKSRLETFLDVDEGLENRIINKLNISNSWNELITNIKCKRYTYNRLNRMLIHILLNIPKNMPSKEPYLRVLGFTKKGQNYLNTIKKSVSEPIYTQYKPQKNLLFDMELQSTYIYAIITNNKSLIKAEYTYKPIIKK